jgi:hypothetical protein
MFVYVRTVGATGRASVQNMKRLIAVRRTEAAGNSHDGVKSCDDEYWLKKI